MAVHAERDPRHLLIEAADERAQLRRRANGAVVGPQARLLFVRMQARNFHVSGSFSEALLRIFDIAGVSMPEHK